MLRNNLVADRAEQVGQLPLAVSDGVSGTRVQRLSPSLPRGPGEAAPQRRLLAEAGTSRGKKPQPERAVQIIPLFLPLGLTFLRLFIYLFLAARGLVPQPRIELRSSAVKSQVLTPGPVGNSLSLALEEVVPQPSLKPKEKMYTPCIFMKISSPVLTQVGKK